jgi:hypothetical protein
MNSEMLFKKAMQSNDLTNIIKHIKCIDHDQFELIYSKEIRNFILNEKFDIIEYFIDKKLISVNYENGFLFSSLCEHNHIEFIKKILTYPELKTSARSNAGLIFASENGFLDLVQLLIRDNRIKPEQYGNWSLKMADENNQLNVFLYLFNLKSVKQYLKDSDEKIYKEYLDKYRVPLMQYKLNGFKND